MLGSFDEKDKNEQPLVSMVSVFYNRGYCVKESVQSMLDQTYSNIEIILVDDESTDNTLEELRKFEFDSRVKVLTHSNMGFTRSIKRAIEEISKGEYIAIHGSGDISLENRLNEQVSFLNSNLDYACVACGRFIVKKTEIKEINSELFISPGRFLSFASNPFSHGEMLFRKSAYLSVGGYREEFEYAQDYDLWLRINDKFWIARVESVLYKEFSREDGVKENIGNTLKQNKFSQMAKLCKKLNYTPSKEEIESFSVLEGQSSVAKHFLKLSLYFILNQRLNFAKRFVDESLRIKFTLAAYIARSLLINKLGLVVARLLKKISKVF